MSSSGTPKYSKTSLPSKHSKTLTKSSEDDNNTQNSKSKQQAESKKKSSISNTSQKFTPKTTPKKDDIEDKSFQSLELTSNIKEQNQNLQNLQLEQLQDDEYLNEQPSFRMSQATHNNGYYSQMNYLKYKKKEMEETFMKTNKQIGDAINRSQKDISLKLSQQVHMSDMFQLPQSILHEQINKNEQYQQDSSYYEPNLSSRFHQDYTNPYNHDNDDSNNYQDDQNAYNYLDSEKQQKRNNLRPSDTKLEDYLLMKNQYQQQQPVHQRLYNQAIIQQKEKQQIQHDDKSGYTQQTIYSIGARNYIQDKQPNQYRSSSNKKQRLVNRSDSKQTNQDDNGNQNEYSQYNYPNQFNLQPINSSQQQDFGDDDTSNTYNNNTYHSNQKIRNNSPGYHISSNTRNLKQENNKLNLPQIDPNFNNLLYTPGDVYPHTTKNQGEIRNSIKQSFRRQQSPLGQSHEFNTTISKTPRLQQLRRDSATRIQDLGNSLQERYSDKIEKMKMRYSKNQPLQQNQEDDYDIHRSQSNQINQQQRKESQQSIQQAAINVEKQRQRIRKQDFEKDSVQMNQNDTYRSEINQDIDHTHQFSKNERQNVDYDSLSQNRRYNQEKRQDDQQQKQKYLQQSGNEEANANQGNLKTKENIKKLTKYNQKLNTTEEKIQKILTKEELQNQEQYQDTKQYNENSRVNTISKNNQQEELNNIHYDKIQNTSNNSRRNSQQNLEILGNKNQRFVEFGNTKDIVQIHQKDLLNVHKKIFETDSNTETSANNKYAPIQNQKQMRIQQTYQNSQRQQQGNENQQQISKAQQQTPQKKYPKNNYNNHKNEGDETEDIMEDEQNGYYYSSSNNVYEREQTPNLDDIYEQKKANIVERVNEHVRDNRNDKIKNHNFHDDQKSKRETNSVQQNQQIEKSRYHSTDQKIKQEIKKRSSSNYQADDESQTKNAQNLRNQYRNLHPTQIDTFESDKNNQQNYKRMANNQNSIDNQVIQNFDSRDNRNKLTPTNFQQKMTFLDKKLSELQILSEKQKQRYQIDQENKNSKKYDFPDQIQEEDRLRKRSSLNRSLENESQNCSSSKKDFTPSSKDFPSSDKDFIETQKKNSPSKKEFDQFIKVYNTPSKNNFSPSRQDYQRDDDSLISMHTKNQEEQENRKGSKKDSSKEKNYEIKSYNMLKNPTFKTINKNINNLENIQNNLGSIEKQIQHLNEKYQKYQTNPNPTDDKEYQNRLNKYQVDEHIYKKVKKYLPQDVNQRANQISKYEQFNASVEDKTQFKEQQQFEDYLDVQIQTQLQKYLPLDVSQRLQVDSDNTPKTPIKRPEFEEYINKKIQERIMAYLPHDISTRLNEMPQENYNVKKSNQYID